jgi:hypothetical protein
VKAPVICRCVLVLASWLVPAAARAAWRGGWASQLSTWWLLTERGDIVFRGLADTLHFCGMLAESAIRERFSRESLELFARGPAVVLLLLASAWTALAGLSGGFSGTRFVLETGASLVLGYSIIVTFAFAVTTVALIVSHAHLRLRPLRCSLFLLLKTAGGLALTLALYVEANGLIRYLMAPGPTRGFINGVAGGVIFIAAFAGFALWSFADQRARCPVCLHRLVMPVRVGSWSSVLDPAATEMLCIEGHGALCISESGAGQPDRWTALDPSWSQLFPISRT